MCFIAPTCDTIVCVPRRSVSWSAPSSFARELHREALGGELDRRQRILDLVREAPRNLGPRGVALRLHELGDVVEHDDIAAAHRRARQARAAHQQRARQIGDARARASFCHCPSRLPRKPSATSSANGASAGRRLPQSASDMPVSSASGCCRITAALGLTDAQAMAIVEHEHARRKGCRGCFRDRRASSRSRAGCPRPCPAPPRAAPSSC